MRCLFLILAAVLAAPAVAAHGDLEINELETLAIRDFEGMEDSFPYEGFEIWDVYVGEGYNQTLDGDGVYFKVNFAGDGTQRPAGGDAWTIGIQFNVGDESFERELTHDGTTITSTFESLQWTIADGNVLQIKAWVPVENGTGKSVTEVVVVSSVDGEPRDMAPGGVYAPGSGSELPVTAPGTPVFPPMGEGRIVTEVPLTGAAKFLNVSIVAKDEATFTVTVTNPLKEQGQHVILDASPSAPWDFSASSAVAMLDGGASTTFDLTIRANATSGMRADAFPIDIISDIGGRQTLYAFLGDEGVALTPDASGVRPASTPEGVLETPGPVLPLLFAALVFAVFARRRA
jgi:hypothetical protein